MMFCTLFSDPPPPCIKSSLPKQVMQCLQSDNVFAQRSQIKQINFFWFDHFFTYWILFEPSCCPERTVLGSDGSSVVYQLASGFLLFMIFIIIFGENHICQHIGYCLYFDSHMFQLSYELNDEWFFLRFRRPLWRWVPVHTTEHSGFFNMLPVLNSSLSSFFIMFLLCLVSLKSFFCCNILSSLRSGPAHQALLPPVVLHQAPLAQVQPQLRWDDNDDDDNNDDNDDDNDADGSDDDDY